MTIKCILFDVDWVIITSEKFSLQYSKNFNISIDKLSPFFITDFKKCIIWNWDLKELIKPWILKWNFEWNVDDFLKLWFDSSRVIDYRMIDFVNKCKQDWIFCYLATNQEKYRTGYMKNQMWFDKIFDWIFSSCYIWAKKPNIEYFDYILNKLKNDYNINSDEILFIDDLNKNIETAKKMWIKTHLYKEFEELNKYFNKWII